MITFTENPIKAANERYDEMFDTLDAQSIAIARIKELLEQLLGISFIVQENGLGPEERDLAISHIWAELQAITGARNTCSLCGDMYTIGDSHNCF